MNAPRNEREFNAHAQPLERCGVKFAGACKPINRRIFAKPQRVSLWQRAINFLRIAR